MRNSRKSSLFLKRCMLLVPVLALGVSLDGKLALADNVDPFHVEDGRWMSLDFYKDGLKKEVAPFSKSEEAPPSEAPAATEPSPAVTAKEASPPDMPVVAAPSRPLDLPVMPGMNKGYSVTVHSMAEDVTPTITPPVLSDSKPDLVPTEKNWQSAVDFNQKHANSKDDDDDHPEIGVRMSFLPNKSIVPEPEPDHVRNHGRAAQVAATLAHSTPVPVKSPADVAACAAIDAYKKKQLEAIQSDRETLSALQAAITQLGLQKQLNFITGTNNITNAESTRASPRQDTPDSNKP